MFAHPAVCPSPLCNSDTPFGGRTEAVRLNNQAREGEPLQYVDEMSVYLYLCKYFKYPVGQTFITCYTRVRIRKPPCVWKA